MLSLSHQKGVRIGLDKNQLVDDHAAASLNDAIFHAIVRTRDQIPKSCTPSGSMEDLKRPKMKDRRENLWE